MLYITKIFNTFVWAAALVVGSALIAYAINPLAIALVIQSLSGGA